MTRAELLCHPAFRKLEMQRLALQVEESERQVGLVAKLLMEGARRLMEDATTRDEVRIHSLSEQSAALARLADALHRRASAATSYRHDWASFRD
jgi:hypothetical protein